MLLTVVAFNLKKLLNCHLKENSVPCYCPAEVHTRRTIFGLLEVPLSLACWIQAVKAVPGILQQPLHHHILGRYT
jgi:hypothetical protein